MFRHSSLTWSDQYSENLIVLYLKLLDPDAPLIDNFFDNVSQFFYFSATILARLGQWHLRPVTQNNATYETPITSPLSPYIAVLRPVALLVTLQNRTLVSLWHFVIFLTSFSQCVQYNQSSSNVWNKCVKHAVLFRVLKCILSREEIFSWCFCGLYFVCSIMSVYFNTSASWHFIAPVIFWRLYLPVIIFSFYKNFPW
jgi:hypothetical protein